MYLNVNPPPPKKKTNKQPAILFNYYILNKWLMTELWSSKIINDDKTRVWLHLTSFPNTADKT